MLQDLPEYAESTAHAKAVAFYNLARILSCEKDLDGARHALDEAAKLDAEEVKFRLQRDDAMSVLANAAPA